MAVDPLDIPITRDQVTGWINIYRSWPEDKKKPTFKDFLLERIKAAQLEGVQVNTSGHDTLRDATPVVDMILMDLESYGAQNLSRNS